MSKPFKLADGQNDRFIIKRKGDGKFILIDNFTNKCPCYSCNIVIANPSDWDYVPKSWLLVTYESIEEAEQKIVRIIEKEKIMAEKIEKDKKDNEIVEIIGYGDGSHLKPTDSNY